MTHKKISIEKNIDGVEGLYMVTHNNDSLGYYLGEPLADIRTIRAAVRALPELTVATGQGTRWANKRDYIRDRLLEQGLLWCSREERQTEYIVRTYEEDR